MNRMPQDSLPEMSSIFESALAFDIQKLRLVRGTRLLSAFQFFAEHLWLHICQGFTEG